MKEDQNENLGSKEALAKEEGLTEKVGNFFTKIGYNIADFCRDHPKITKSTLVALSTTAGFFTAGPPGAIGGFFAGFQGGKNVLEFCNEFADKYEKEHFAGKKGGHEVGKEAGQVVGKEGSAIEQGQPTEAEKRDAPNPTTQITSAASLHTKSTGRTP